MDCVERSLLREAVWSVLRVCDVADVGASRGTLCLGDARIYSLSDVGDTDEGDNADFVWYVPVSESRLLRRSWAYMSCKSASGS